MPSETRPWAGAGLNSVENDGWGSTAAMASSPVALLDRWIHPIRGVRATHWTLRLLFVRLCAPLSRPGAGSRTAGPAARPRRPVSRARGEGPWRTAAGHEETELPQDVLPPPWPGLCHRDQVGIFLPILALFSHLAIAVLFILPAG